jgi:hypothetical protein
MLPQSEFNYFYLFECYMKKSKPKAITLLGETILAGESKTINMEIARLHTTTKLKIPIIIERSKIDGPIVLFLA